MAQMFPPDLDARKPPGSGKGPSDQERKVWRALRDHLSDEWMVLHSRWMRTHKYKLDAEADFFLIGPQGIFVLEVKGGGVTRLPNGNWQYTNSRGKTNEKGESPLEQARGAMYGLNKFFKSTALKSRIDSYVWGYGLITLDCTLDVPSDPEFQPWMVLGDLRFPDELQGYVKGLAEHYRRETEEKKGWTEVCDLTREDRERLKKMVMPEIPVANDLGVRALRAEQVIQQLTTEQLEVLEGLAENPRVILSGGAGTGKTVLAVEQARRNAVKGQRVLFVCFNRALATYLSAQYRGEEEFRNVDFLNFHQLIGHYLQRLGVGERQVPEDWSEFNEKLWGLFEDIFGDARWSPPYDVLVLDEGQDLLAAQFVDVLGLFLKDGFKEGRWTICLDPNQAIFEDNYDPSTLEGLKSTRPVEYGLKKNCRNTRQVNAYVLGLSGVEPGDSVGSTNEGPPPNVTYYTNDTRKISLRKTLNRVIDDFRKNGVRLADVLVLFARTDPYLAELEELCDAGRIEASVVKFVPDGSNPETEVQWQTIQAYKGLEAKAVILVGLESLQDKVSRRLYYVGASRAQSVLEILLPNDAQTDVQLGTRTILKLLSDGR
jgi:hypothetical protein